ncbi:MAG: hypothetical protein NTAFB05_26700 [Nitrobacter sp.]
MAREYGVSVPRVRQIFEREEKKEQRQQELAEANRRPDQPNLLHLEWPLRAMLADFCDKAEFTPDDVEKRGFWRSNFSCDNAAWRGVVKWMALAGKEPAKPPYKWTIEEWHEHNFGGAGKRP